MYFVLFLLFLFIFIKFDLIGGDSL